ncbi:MAG: serine protease [Gammaproteobacteria bacterium]
MDFLKQKLTVSAATIGLAMSCGVNVSANDVSDIADAVPAQETVFSRVLRFQGDVVAVTADGKEIRQTAFMRGKRFEYVGEAGARRAAPEQLSDTRAPDIDTLSVEELAENLRGTALFRGHQFIEAEPALELAREAKQLRELELKGASQEELEAVMPGRPASQGTAERTTNMRQAEMGEDGKGNERIVHGTDERRVMGNTYYPHRTHIVFDNTGSNWSIGGSQGSGTLIGPSTALSVAHVFWDEGANTWESTHRWAPGYDSADSNRSPYGEWYGCYWVTIPTAYTTYENSTYDYAIIDFDVGCNSVRDGVNSDHPGTTVGWLGNLVASTSTIEGRTNYLRGYPGSGTCGNPGTSCGTRIWGDTSSTSETDATSNITYHQADSSGGMSGSGMYIYTDPSCSGCGYGAYVVGMHRAGAASANSARRYTSTVRSFMKAYSSDY